MVLSVQGLFQSGIQNGIKFTLSIALIALGLLQLFNRLNPLDLKPIDNTFIFGMLFGGSVTLGIIGSLLLEKFEN